MCEKWPVFAQRAHILLSWVASQVIIIYNIYCSLQQSGYTTGCIFISMMSTITGLPLFGSDTSGGRSYHKHIHTCLL